jgi:hypothetical protein
MSDETTYKIVRTFHNTQYPAKTISTGLTLEEARGHCSDPESSSRTCKVYENVARGMLYGPWFDSYEEE